MEEGLIANTIGLVKGMWFWWFHKCIWLARGWLFLIGWMCT